MRRSVFAFALTLGLLGSSSVWAQADNAARAQALFEQAVTASRAGDYATACPKFAASQRLDPKTSTLLNLGSCYELNGQTASAWAAFKEAEAAARKYGRTDWADRAATATKNLEPKLIRLTVHIPEPVRTIHVHVELDGTQLHPTEWEQPMPVDPGSHRLDWSAPDHKPSTRAVDVTASMSVTLTELERLPPPPPSMVVSGPPRDAGPARFWTTGRVVGTVLGGVGIASVVAGSVFGLSADAKYSEAEDLCGVSTGTPRVCLPERSQAAIAARDDAAGRATASTVFFVAGGVLAAGGIALFVLSSPNKQQRVAMVPWPNGLAAVGRW